MFLKLQGLKHESTLEGMCLDTMQKMNLCSTELIHLETVSHFYSSWMDESKSNCIYRTYELGILNNSVVDTCMFRRSCRRNYSPYCIAPQV